MLRTFAIVLAVVILWPEVLSSQISVRQPGTTQTVTSPTTVEGVPLMNAPVG